MRHAISAVMVSSNRDTTDYTAQLGSGRIITKHYPRRSLQYAHYDRIRRLANSGRYRVWANVGYPGFTLMRKDSP